MRLLKITSYLLLLITLSCQEEAAVVIDLKADAQSPVLFAEGVISTDLYERDIAISADGDEIIYTLGNYKQTLRCLVSIKKEKGQWGEKQILPFSGRYNDIEPFFSVDGQKLYFASTRPIDADTTRTDYNIWVANKSGTAWQEPRPLDTLINSKRDEFYPAVSANGNLYFTATREGGIGREDIFYSKFENGKYQPAVVLDSTVNTGVYEFNAYISPKEDLLVFSSFGRKDGLGGGDLYYSTRSENGKWSAAKNMGELVNSDKLDYCPFIDSGRSKFYFSSDRDNTATEQINSVAEFIENARATENGMGNIYMVNLESLNLK